MDVTAQLFKQPRVSIKLLLRMEKEVSQQKKVLKFRFRCAGNAEISGCMPILKNTDGGRWLIKCLNGRGNFICAYDIYFLDEAGNRINAKGVTVIIDSPADTDNLEFSVFLQMEQWQWQIIPLKTTA